LLIWTQATTVEALKEKRPYIIVGAFVVGMLLTPPDVISQTLLAVPIWLLFEMGLFSARFLPKKQQEL
jgi:sec-independent protein translocase protein TatC